MMLLLRLLLPCEHARRRECCASVETVGKAVGWWVVGIEVTAETAEGRDVSTGTAFFRG